MPSPDGRACCAVCHKYYRVDQMDVVDYGSGYRCPRCGGIVAAADQEVAAAEEAAARQQRNQPGPLDDIT